MSPAGVAASAINEERVAALFRPPLADRSAMSPDGRYVAYTRHAGNDLTIVIMDLDRPGVKTTLIVDEDRPVTHSREKARAELRFLRWATANRLVFAPTPQVFTAGAGGQTIIVAPIMAADAAGRNARTLTHATDFQEVEGAGSGSLDPAPTVVRMRMPHIVGFAAGDREHLLVEAAGAEGLVPRPTELFRVNVHSGAITLANAEFVPGRHIYDWQGRRRLIRERADAAFAKQTFLYHPVGSGRWRKLHELGSVSDAAHFTVTPENYYGERAVPLGFSFDPNVLIYGANVGRDTFGIYGLNLATFQRTSLSLEHPHRDLAPLSPSIPSPTLVFDEWRHVLAGVRAQGEPPRTVWVEREMADVQRLLDEKFPRRSAHIIEWDEKRTSFLVRVTGGTEPGRYFIYRRPDDLAVEIFRCMPWLPNAALHDTRHVEFAGPGGAQLSGYLTLPQKPRLKPPPLVLVFAGGFPPEPHEEFDPEAHVLADMGFAVLRLNQRGVLGHGARAREALRDGIDRVASEDARAAIEWIASRHPIDRKRVAVMGQGFAGYLAVRATQIEPAAFRCAIAIEPPLNLDAWLQPPVDVDAPPPTFQQQIDRAFLENYTPNLRQLSALAQAGALSLPVFVIYRAHRGDAIAQGVAALRGQLRRRDIPHETVDVKDDYLLRLPAARVHAYRRLEEFFNLNLYNYDVRIGPTRIVR